MTHIGICVPTAGQVKSQFMISLLGMVLTSKLKWSLFIEESSNIPNNREQLVRQALDQDCSHVMFLDDDMAFSNDVLPLMFSRNAPIVLTNYPQRVFPIRFSSGYLGSDGNVKEVIPTLETSTGTQEVDFGGFGVSLIEANVFKQIGQPWFAPSFDPNTGTFSTEDIPFFILAKSLGIPIIVDHDASKHVGHCGTHQYSWKDK